MEDTFSRYIPDQGTVIVIVFAMIERPLSTCEQEWSERPAREKRIGKRPSLWDDKKDEQDECQDGYFGTLPTPWLVMKRSTYLETLYCTCFYISTWTWVSASSTVKGTEAVSRRSDKARVNTKMFLMIIIINRDIFRRILVLLGIDQSPPIVSLSPSKSPFLLIFWSYKW